METSIKIQLKEKNEEWKKRFNTLIKISLISLFAFCLMFLVLYESLSKEEFRAYYNREFLGTPTYIWALIVWLIIVVIFMIPVIKTMIEHNKLRKKAGY